jgi:hypothetical protein
MTPLYIQNQQYQAKDPDAVAGVSGGMGGIVVVWQQRVNM